MTSDKDFSDFVYHGFEGIESSFTNISVVRNSSHNILLKARRYGQWWLLKGLLPEEKDEPVFQEMLRKEFEILIQLQHPNVVRAFSIEQVEEWGICIVMEWVEGDTLLEYMKTAPDNQKKL
jgi:serine/threonine protein kinase